MNTPTLGDKLGLSPRVSPLLRKAAALGLPDAEALEALAVARGCGHYWYPQILVSPDVAESLFSNEELAIALLSPGLPYSPRSIRLGASMLGAEGNRIDTLASLGRDEGCELAIRYIAQSAIEFEPNNAFWPELLGQVPATGEAPDGVFPHPTRFVSMTGITRAGVGRVAVWLRPLKTKAAARA